MIEKHKQKSKKPATVSRATEESKTESDQAKGKLVALPGDCSLESNIKRANALHICPMDDR